MRAMTSVAHIKITRVRIIICNTLTFFQLVFRLYHQFL